jgi:diguanylate cyclase (GGDEF)-like protein/PAS domain S-box-containing protein
VSNTAATFIGRPPAELVGMCYWDIFPKAHSTFEEHYRQAMETGQARSFEAPSHHRIGAWYETQVYPHEQGLSIYARDISDRKRAEKALYQSQERLELLRQRSPLGIIEWDTDFCILTWNAAAETIFGFREEEVLGQSTADLLIPQEVRPHITTLISNTVGQKHVTHSINENLTKSGKVIICEWYNVPLTTSQGTVIGITGLVQNVSQREYAQSKLNRLAEFRRQLIDLSREVLQNDTSDAAALYHYLLAKAIAPIPGAQAGSIMVRRDDGHYYFVAAEGYDLEGLRDVILHESDLHIAPDENSAKVAHNPENYEVASLDSEGNAYFNDVGRVAEIRAMLTVPVVVGNTRQAVLFIDNFVSEDAFDADAIEMAEIYAGQIGVYLRRLWLESELRERELRSRALLEAIPDTISRHDATGRYLDIRPGLHHVSLLPLQDRLGQTVHDMIGDSHPDIAKMFHDAQQRALETRQIQRFEFRFSHQGTWQYREVRVVATDALDVQNARETIIIVRDVTRQKEAEQALRDSENRYRIISDVMTDVLYAYKRDNHGNFVRDWNSGVGEVRLTGYEPAEIDTLGGWAAIVHPDDKPIAHSLAQSSRPQRLVIEYRIITKTGDIKWVRDFSRAVFDASGKVVIALFGANQDITEQKQAEQALEDAKADLERALDENTLILESITDSFVSLDSDWRLRYVNQRALSYTAFDDVSQVLTRPYVEVFGFAKRLPLEQVFNRTLTRNTPEQLEVFWQERDLWLELRIYPNRAGLAIYATDISDRKRMEFALTASNRELNRHASELAALNHMMEVLTSATRVRDALEAVAPLIAQLLNLEGVSVSLLDAPSSHMLPWSPTAAVTHAGNADAGNTVNANADNAEADNANAGNANAGNADADSTTANPTSDATANTSSHNEPAEHDPDWTDTATLREVVRFSNGQSHVLEHAPAIKLSEDTTALNALRDNEPVHVSEAATLTSGHYQHFGVTHQLPPPGDSATHHTHHHTNHQGYCKLILPLRSQHLLMGVLHLAAADSQRTFSNAEIELAETVAGQLASALSNVQLLEAQQRINRDLHHANAQLADAKGQLELKNKRLITLSTRDGLTGIYNRRHLETQLAKEFARVTRYKLPLSVMICDIDDFKHVNDTFSHGIGDEVLRQVAAIMQQHTRDIDIVARYGGEEFVIVFPETKPEDAYQACEKIRLLVANQSWDDLAPGLRVTLSLGLTGHTTVHSHEEMLNRADTLLYNAKNTGKNRIIMDNTSDDSSNDDSS